MAWHGTVLAIVCSSLGSLLAGCGSPSSEAETAVQLGASLVGERTIVSSQEANAQRRLDAGIIFADQASYLCVPLEQLGIASAEQIRSIETSCECLQARALTYGQSADQLAQALRLDFVPAIKPNESTAADHKGTTSNRRSPNLNPIIMITLRSGETLDVEVKILQTMELIKQ